MNILFRTLLVIVIARVSGAREAARQANLAIELHRQLSIIG